jgi:hypothetical protein
MDPTVQASWITGGASLLGSLFGRSKGPKIPAPKTAEQMKADMDTMYTGTTPWERLGASGGGVPQAAAQQDSAKIQAKVQQQAHKNQMAITQSQILGNMAVANINAKNKLDVVEASKPVTTKFTGPMIDKAMDVLYNKGEYATDRAKEYIQKFNEPKKKEKELTKRKLKIHSSNWSGHPLHDGKSGISYPLNHKGLKNPSTPNAMTYADWIKEFTK